MVRGVEIMGGRYWITGAQLGMFVAYKEPDDRHALVSKIIDDQFIGKKNDLKGLINDE